MSNLDLLSALVGSLLPAVVAVVNRSHWSPAAKGLVAIGVSVLAGGLTAYFTGDLSGRTWAQSALIIAAAAVASYRVWWQPTGIGPAIERATTPGDG